MIRRNPCLDVALRTLNEAGIRDIVQAHGGKHLQLRWRANGNSQRMYSMSQTPSDHRAPLNVRSDIRNMLREDGLLNDETKPPPPPSLPPAAQRIANLERQVTVLRREVAELKRRVDTTPPDNRAP
jgi:hypothetical protein